MGRTISNLNRLREISTVVGRHGLDHFLEGRRQRRRRARRSTEESTEVSRQRSAAVARRFRNVLEELGTTFIKFGQVLSTRGDLVTPELAHALGELQDNCAPLPIEAIEAQLKATFGCHSDALFASFDAKPLASASIAQVHAATTFEGDSVVVKVQRPGVRQQVIGDLDLLRYLARLCEAIIEESGVVTPRAVVDTFEEALLGELDFAHEADMLRRFAQNLEGTERRYAVPAVYPALSRGTVLTMERMVGRPLSELSAADNGPEVAGRIVEACFEQVFVDGLFHGDPHPGNCLVLEDGRLALIDFGTVGKISYAMRETLVMLVLAIGMRDAEAVARLLYRVGIPDERVSLHRLRDACASLLDERLRDRATFVRGDAAGLLQELFALVSRFGVRVPSEYALIGHAAMTVEGILRQLDPEFTVIDQAKPMLRRLIEQQFSLDDLPQSTLRGLLRARDLARELPLTLSQIAMDLENGKLRVQVENSQFALIARSIDTLGLVIFTGCIAGALVCGALFMLAPYKVEMRGLPVLPLLALYCAGMLFGAAFGRSIFGSRLRKISIGRWLQRRRRR